MAFRRIVIALDDGAVAAHAARVGCDLAKALAAEVAFVFVVDPTVAYEPDGGIPLPELIAEMKRSGERLMATAAQYVGSGSAWQFVREGKPADQIVATAREWAADLIVIGTHGRTGVSRVVLGSTAESVLRRAGCPVLVVRAGQDQPETA